MNEQMLARCQCGTVLVQETMVEVELSASPVKAPGIDANPLSRKCFVQMANAGLEREIAASGRDILLVASYRLQKCVGRETEQLKVPGLVHVPVVVGPIQRHDTVDGSHRAVGNGRPLHGGHLPFAFAQEPSDPPIPALEAAHHRNEVCVPDFLKFPDRSLAGLFIGLAGNPLCERVIKVRNIGQACPGEFETWAKLLHEVLHSLGGLRQSGRFRTCPSGPNEGRTPSG